MRISSDPDDRAFHLHANYCRIFLEGSERSNVITADEDRRFAVTLRLDEFGQPVRDKKTGKVLRDLFHGHVRIECSDWLRVAMESPQEEPDTLSGVIYGMITTP